MPFYVLYLYWSTGHTNLCCVIISDCRNMSYEPELLQVFGYSHCGRATRYRDLLVGSYL